MSAATGRGPALRRPGRPPQGGPGARHRPGPLHRRHDAARDGLDDRRAQPARARAHPQGRRLRRARAARRRRGVHRRGSRVGVGRRPAVRVADPVDALARAVRHRPAHADALAARQGQGALRRRRRRGRDRGLARARGRRGRVGRRRLGAARRRRSRSRTRRPTARRSSTRTSATTAATRGASPAERWSRSSSNRPCSCTSGTSIRVSIPNAIEPRGVIVLPVAVAGRVHHLVGDADPAHPADDARADARDPRVEAARDRTRRRRRLRLEAERLRRGGALPRGRAQARHAGEVDRGALRGVRRHHPRPRRDPGHRARRDRGGEAARRAREAARRHGRVLPARVARHPAARRVPLRRRLRRRGLPLRVHRRPHEQDADGRVSRRRPAGGDVRDRAGDGRARASRRQGPGGDPAAATTSRRSTSRTRSRRDSSSTPATSSAGSTARSRSSATTSLRAEQRKRRESGDTKQLGIGLSTYIEMCGLAPSQVLAALNYVAGGWDAAVVRCHPTGKVTVVTGTSPHGQGHVTTWAQITADKLGVPFEDVDVLHGDTAISPLGMDTYGSRSLSVGGVALWYATEKVLGEGAADRGARARGRGRGSRVARRRVPGQGRAGPGEDDPGARVLRVDGARAAGGRRADARGDLRLGPAELHVPVGHARLRRRGRHGDRRDGDRALRRRRRLRRGDQPDDRRRADPRRHRAGHRRGDVRGGGVRRERQPR